MKFSIQRDVFTEQLAHISRAVPAKATIPVLTGIKITASPDGLVLIGSDSKISIESFIDVKDELNGLTIEENGSVVVTARLFNDIVRKLPTSHVQVSVDNNFEVTIQSGSAVFNLNGVDGNTYPRLPELQDEGKFKLPTALFKQMIDQTIFSASNQETRPILTGLHLINETEGLVGIATDSHRLSRREIPINSDQVYFEPITIPKKTVTELTRIVEDDQALYMMVADQQVIFVVDNMIIYSRILEGSYPETSQLIPSQYQTELILNADKFLQAIERAALISHQGKNNVVQLDLQAEGVALSVRNNERGFSTEALEYESLSGEDLTISFNPDYMKDALRSFNGVDIKIQLQSPVRPLLILPKVKSEVDHNDLLQLITPIRTH